jgi:ubiquinone/menaquinone biosynthesis C-methylase UbiE
VLSEIVGPQGRVVGVDFSNASLNKAWSVICTLSLENLELLTGDLNARTGEGLICRRFDLALRDAF